MDRVSKTVEGSLGSFFSTESGVQEFKKTVQSQCRCEEKREEGEEEKTPTPEFREPSVLSS